MKARATTCAIALVLLGACGGSTMAEPVNEPAPEVVTSGSDSVTAEATTEVSPNPWSGRTGTGIKAESAVSACGPADSYRFVAAEFECPEGGNPLGGDPAAGQAARAGNVGANTAGHIIDRYEVPCGGGPVSVYVDMYGCPEMEAQLRSFQGGTP